MIWREVQGYGTNYGECVCGVTQNGPEILRGGREVGRTAAEILHEGWGEVEIEQLRGEVGENDGLGLDGRWDGRELVCADLPP